MKTNIMKKSNVEEMKVKVQCVKYNTMKWKCNDK